MSKIKKNQRKKQWNEKRDFVKSDRFDDTSVTGKQQTQEGKLYVFLPENKGFVTTSMGANEPNRIRHFSTF